MEFRGQNDDDRLFAGTFVYLLIKNSASPTYATPTELTTAMTAIIGYYFGVGASSAFRAGKTVTEERVKEVKKGDVLTDEELNQIVALLVRQKGPG